MIRVVLVDDHALLRSGLAAILGATNDIAVVGEAATGRSGVEVVRSRRPDLVLMDVEMPDGDGISATAAVLQTCPQTRVLILTTFDLEEYVLRALQAGASGFLLKSAPPEELTRAVRAAAAGEPQLAPSVTRRMMASYLSTAPLRPAGELPPEVSGLTPREVEVLRAVARGLSNAEIAGTLFLSEATVKTHVTRILAKLQLRDRMQAAVLAYETGLVQPGQLETS